MTPTKLYPVNSTLQKLIDEMNQEKVYLYLKRKLQIRKFNKRPLECTYGQIGRKMKLTYKQIRRIINILVKKKIIEKWTTVDSEKKKKIMYLRWKIQKM